MSDAFAAVPRPLGRDLTSTELLAFVDELGGRPELWIDRVVHDARRRIYEQLIGDAHLTAWLICWMEEQDTGFHDHDLSSGAVAVLGGRIREQRLVLDGPPRDRVYGAGASFSFSPADIHRVTHAGEGPAVSLHVYSPPLVRMGTYRVAPDGVLVRESTPASRELRPQAPAPAVAAAGEARRRGRGPRPAAAKPSHRRAGASRLTAG